MKTIFILILLTLTLTDFLLVKLGLGFSLGLKRSVLCLLEQKESRVFIIFGIVCAGVLVLGLATGVVSVHDLIEMERMKVEMCPWCMGMV